MEILREMIPELRRSCIEFARLHHEMESLLSKICFQYTCVVNILSTHNCAAAIDTAGDFNGEV